MGKFLNTLQQYSIQIARPIVTQTVDDLYLEVQKISPVRTGQYLSQHKREPIRVEGDEVIGAVSNAGEYPIRVEQGFRKTPVNWSQKQGGTYRGVGANVYQRARQKVEPNFKRRLLGA